MISVTVAAQTKTLGGYIQNNFTFEESWEETLLILSEIHLLPADRCHEYGKIHEER